MALSGCHRPVKVMPIEKIWTELPLIHIMNAIIPTLFIDDCAISHTFCNAAPSPHHPDQVQPTLTQQPQRTFCLSERSTCPFFLGPASSCTRQSGVPLLRVWGTCSFAAC